MTSGDVVGNAFSPEGRQDAFREAREHARQPDPAWRELARTCRPVSCMGLTFPNRLGIAAGFDRTGTLGKAAGNLGFGAIEIGSWNRRPGPETARQPDIAPLLETRVGLRLATTDTGPAELQTRQLTVLIEDVWDMADYLCVAPGWLQPRTPPRQLQAYLRTIRDCQATLTRRTGKHCPVVFKLRAIPGTDEGFNLVPYLAAMDPDGILLSFDFGKPFTTQHRQQWRTTELQALTCHSIERCRNHLKGNTALLTNGGVYSARTFRDRLAAGADLVQLHNALVGRGPDIAWTIHREMLQACHDNTSD